MPEPLESSHMGHPDFRVRGKIFATLGPGETWGMLKLTVDQQRRFVQNQPAVFVPIRGGWGKRGATQVILEAATVEILHNALITAWRNVAPEQLVQGHELE
jgi:hypothetical protein